MAEYVLMIVGDADRWWTTMSEQERRHGYAEYARFGQQLTERGHRVTGGAELQGSAQTRRLEAGGTSVTEGPFAESVEQVGGFYVVDSDDVDDLLDCCKIITALGDAVEVRPTVQAQDRPS